MLDDDRLSHSSLHVMYIITVIVFLFSSHFLVLFIFSVHILFLCIFLCNSKMSKQYKESIQKSVALFITSVIIIMKHVFEKREKWSNFPSAKVDQLLLILRLYIKLRKAVKNWHKPPDISDQRCRTYRNSERGKVRIKVNFDIAIQNSPNYTAQKQIRI